MIQKKKIIFLIALLFISILRAKANDIIVSPGSSITSLNRAIELSSTGDRIIVKKGFYSEGNIEVNKPVEIIGENFPVIDGGEQFQILTIKSNNVKISGLIIRNSGSSNLNDLAGIRIENTSDCTIENNQLENNFFSVSLYNCSHCIIKANIITGNAERESTSGNGIHLWKCDSVSIEDNFISGHRDGIYFEFVTNSFISNNVSRNNLRYGLHFMFSHYDSYQYNTFSNNGAGVAVMYTKHVEMKGNLFKDNWGANSYGLLLKDISDSFIHNNIFNKNTTAIYMEGSARISIIENNFNENGWALKILGDCSEDTLIHNNFNSNTFDVATNSSRNNNFFLENYWDKYRGYDLNKDNVGDISYRPVSLFSMMIEKTPETLFLLRSFIADILDLAEKVAPVFIPETLTDERPLMKQYGMDFTEKY